MKRRNKNVNGSLLLIAVVVGAAIAKPALAQPLLELIIMLELVIKRLSS